MPDSTSHRVVIIGGGFGGLKAAQRLRRAPVHVTLIDRRNFHLFQPLLYQVAAGMLSPANIASPLRQILKRQANCQVIMAEVTGIDAARRVVIANGKEVPYDSLIVATGASHFYFGKDHWAPLAPGLKTIEDATEIRKRILSAFEEAEFDTDLTNRLALTTFVVVGGGPTGVELAGAIREIANFILRYEYRRINAGSAEVILVERSDRILSTYPEDLSKAATDSLKKLGVVVRTGVSVTDIRYDGVTIETHDGPETIPTRTVLWGAGVAASPLGKIVADATGAQTDGAGRIKVNPDMTVGQNSNIYAIGDLAHALDASGKPLPGVAQAALQQGVYVAKQIAAKLRGETLPPFRYFDLGSMATIGRSSAVAFTGRIKFHGFIAWLAWLFIHLMYIVAFKNRVLILMQWAILYISWNRTAGLITWPNKNGSNGQVP
jgi:NADH dehydrogenase